MNVWKRAALVACFTGVLAGCAVETSRAPQTSPSASPAGSRTDATKSINPQSAARLQQIMVPLIQKMDRPVPVNTVRVGVIESAEINAANASPTEFYVTTGLMTKASDDQLRGVLAHEIAHADLGHVAKTQALGTGLTIGTIILDQIIPGSGAITPLAGKLLVNAYTRKEEYEADAHGVELLRRVGLDGKGLMANTLTWLQNSTGGGSKGGFFSTHPATGDRIEAVQKLN